MSRFPLVGIAGLARAGKDAAAARLVGRWGFVRIGFADALKAEVRTKFRRTILAHWAATLPPHMPSDTAAEDRLIDALLQTKPPVIRALLQEHGTEVRRADDPDYWVQAWLRLYNENTRRRVVVPDVRFANEAAMIRRWGATWKVMRPGCAGAGAHDSEIGAARWPDSAFDLVLDNKGTLDDLHAAVDTWAARAAPAWPW
jgi:hypothetical protein